MITRDVGVVAGDVGWGEDSIEGFGVGACVSSGVSVGSSVGRAMIAGVFVALTCVLDAGAAHAPIRSAKTHIKVQVLLDEKTT